jgi:hypothetical protein
MSGAPAKGPLSGGWNSLRCGARLHFEQFSIWVAEWKNSRRVRKARDRCWATIVGIGGIGGIGVGSWCLPRERWRCGRNRGAGKRGA